MIPQLPLNDIGRGKRICDSAHRLIPEGKRLFSSRNGLMKLAALLRQTPAKLCPIPQQQRADLGQLIVIRSNQFHRRTGFFLFEQVAFTFQQFFVPGQQITVSGTNLTDGAVQKFSSTGGRTFDQIQIFRRKQHAAQILGKLQLPLFFDSVNPNL